MSVEKHIKDFTLVSINNYTIFSSDTIAPIRFYTIITITIIIIIITH